MTADDIIDFARECLGTPFRHQGRVVGVGLDCAGVVAHVMRRTGLPYKDAQGYPRTPYANMIEQVMGAQPTIDPVALDAIQPGDILLMRFSKEPQHLAVCAGDTIIHAYESVGKCVEHRFDSKWRARVVRAYRIRGLA